VTRHPDVEAYLAAVDEPHRATLVATRATLRSILPNADEAMKYGMPTFVVAGKSIASYAAFKDHCGYFPHSSGVLERAGEAIAGYPTSKGGLRFGPDRPLPKTLVKRLVRLRMDELADVTDGKRIELYDDGMVKAEGAMKAGQLHGAWRWYRKDGSLLRTGSFRAGEQSGTWQTHDAGGNVVTTRTY
jgi:uncharacterized protein YdhG (YjbR/CyaY superfamily)